MCHPVLLCGGLLLFPVQGERWLAYPNSEMNGVQPSFSDIHERDELKVHDIKYTENFNFRQI